MVQLGFQQVTLLEQQVLKEHKVQLERKERKVQQVLKELKVLKVLKERPVLMVSQVHLE